MPIKTQKHTKFDFERLAERVLTQRSHPLIQNNESDFIATNYREHKRDELGDLHRYANAFAKSHLAPLAEIVPAKNEFRIRGITSEYKNLLTHLSMNFRRIRDAYPKYKQSPIFEVFENVQRRFPEVNSGAYRELMTEQQALHLIKKLKVAARFLHRRLRSPCVKKAYSNFRRNAQKTYWHLLAYFDSCFRTRSNLLAVRIDLGFYLNDRHILQPDDSDQCPDFDSVADWRDQFIDHLDKTFKDNLIGRVLKIEHGPEKKFHLHCLVLLDAAKHQKDVMIGKQLGEYWSKFITKGQGGYFNVNGSRTRHLWPALGKIDGTNPTVQVGLQLMAAYFTLAELYIKPIFAGDRRTLTNGCITEHKRAHKSKRGKYKGGIMNVRMHEAVNRIGFI